MRNRIRNKRETLSRLISLYNNWDFYTKGNFTGKIIIHSISGKEVHTKDSLLEKINKIKNT